MMVRWPKIKKIVTPVIAVRIWMGMKVRQKTTSLIQTFILEGGRIESLL